MRSAKAVTPLGNFRRRWRPSCRIWAGEGGQTAGGGGWQRNVGAPDRWVRFSGGALLLILGFRLHPAPWTFWLLTALGATELCPPASAVFAPSTGSWAGLQRCAGRGAVGPTTAPSWDARAAGADGYRAGFGAWADRDRPPRPLLAVMRTVAAGGSACAVSCSILTSSFYAYYAATSERYLASREGDPPVSTSLRIVKLLRRFAAAKSDRAAGPRSAPESARRAAACCGAMVVRSRAGNLPYLPANAMMGRDG